MPLQPALFGYASRPCGDRIQGSRPYQEDDFGHWLDRDERLVLLVADGLGGHRGGAEASRTALESFHAAFDAAEGDFGARMATALNIANKAIGLKSLSENRYFGMGCTVVACVVADMEVHWISAGDSPLWKVSATPPAGAGDPGQGQPARAVGIRRLNEDHSGKGLARKLLSEGTITEQEAARYNPNELTSALVGDRIPRVDHGSAPLEAGAWLLLASDGLETLSESEIEKTCREKREPQEIVRSLLARVDAAEEEGQDNATVIAYRHE